MDATLGILQQFVAGGLDGFALALDSMSDDRRRSSASLHRLGEVTAQMHTLLGQRLPDPTFAPESPSSESLGLLSARSTTRSRASGSSSPTTTRTRPDPRARRRSA